ncbi:MAG: S-layer homology domain-containing protein [Clostridia bacterium]|nr:S-layer homology domain-containing protein [Clostridia bacterium]
MKNRFERTASLILTLVMLLSMLFCLQAAADVTEDNPNLIPNHSYEEFDEAGLPLGITPYGNSWEGPVKVTDEKAYDGKYSLCIENNGQYIQPWAAFSVTEGLVEEATYELTAMVLTEDFAAGIGCGFKLELYDADGKNFYGGDGTVDFEENTVGVWTQIHGTFTLPKGTAYVKLLARLYSNVGGKVWFDDACLRRGKNPDPYKFTVNTKAPYADSEFGLAIVDVHPFYNGQNLGAETAVDFSVVDPENGNVVDNWSASSMEGDTVTYKYPVAKLEPLHKEFEVRAVVKDKNGNVLAEFSDRVAKFNRPTRLTKDGKYVFEDGKEFHPNIGYHLDSSDYGRAAEMGINVVQIGFRDTATLEQRLAEAEKYGLKILACMYSASKVPGSHPDYIENTKTIVELCKGNDTIFGYALQDEPFVGGNTPEMHDMLWEGYKMIRSIEDEIPVFLVDAYSMYFYEDVKYCDVFYSENYSAGTKATQMAAEQARVCELADRYWGVLGGTWRYSLSQEIQDTDMLRDTFYRSFAEGSKGVGYYAISDADGALGQPLYTSVPETWAGLSRYAAEELPELFAYYCEDQYETFGRFYTTDPLNGLGDYYEAWVRDGALSMVIHNQDKETKTYEIPMVSSNGLVKIGEFEAVPIAGSTEKITGNGTLTITLEPNKSVFYHISPKGSVDFSRVSEETGKKNHFALPGAEPVADETAKPTGTFGDLAGFEWASEQIQALYDEGIVNDRNIYAFAPGENITREDFVVFLVRTLGLSGDGEAFPDCDTAEVKTARTLGIVNGDENGNFNPGAPITRQDLFAVSARARGVANYEGETPVFSDWEQVADYAKNSISAMAAAGVVQGNGDGTLRPLDFTTRAQAAVLLFRLRDAEFPEVTPEDTPEEMPEEKEVISFTDTPSEITLKNWSDATDLLKALDIGEVSAEISVTKGEFEALISGITGAEYSYFEDDLKAIRFEEAVEALVELLGYGVYTARDGGYLGVANQINLIKGVSPMAEHLRGGEVAMLIANALDIYVVSPASYGTGADGRYATAEETLLEMYKKIYKFTGVVEQNWYTSDSLKREQTVIGGLVFEGGKDYLGQKVSVYASEEDEVRTVRYIKPHRAVSVLELDKDMISAGKTNTSHLCYDTGKEEVYENIAGAQLIKNGRYKSGWTAEDITGGEGTVALISNSGSSVDYIIVWTYVNRVVDKVYTLENTITFKEGESLQFDTTDPNARKVLYRSNGEEAPISVVGEFSILSIATSEDNKVCIVRYSSRNVTGTVSEIGDKTVVIDGTEYKIAKSLLESRKLKKPSLDMKAKFSQDYSGKIAAVDTSMARRNYGYFTKAQMGKGVDAKISFRIFTMNNEMKIFEGADKLTVNNVPTKHADVLNNTELFNALGEPKGQLVVYETNEEGKLTELTTALDISNTGFLYQGDVDAFNYVGYADGLRSGFYKYGSKYRHNASTVWFSVPAAYSENEKDYAVVPASEITHEGMGSLESGYLYDLSSEYYLGAVVMITEVANDVTEIAPAGVVIGTSKALDADGFETLILRVRDNRNNEKKLEIPSADFDISFGSWCMTNPRNDEASTVSANGLASKPKTIKPSQLHNGDVVAWELDPFTGKVAAMQVYFRADSPPSVGTMNPALGEDTHYVQRFVGYFRMDKVVDMGFIVTQPHERMFNFWSFSTMFNVLVYEKDTGKCYKIDYEDVRAGENILYLSWAYMMQLGVIYR